jgi:broad specificity phosphatase PhoE
MNEYLGGADGGKRFGSPDFTDIFECADRHKKYKDTPLSPLGRKQAATLASKRCPEFVQDCELVVTSPLTRALQTFDIGLKPHFDYKLVPVLALPEAAERLYLISDVGRAVADLQTDFPYVDFETGFAGRGHDDTAWWYKARDNHQEWRPKGRDQRYACAGEPIADFDLRMSQLHAWLAERSETNIAVVCHHGVIDWMLDLDFANCQYRQVPFANIQPHSLVREFPIQR